MFSELVIELSKSGEQYSVRLSFRGEDDDGFCRLNQSSVLGPLDFEALNELYGQPHAYGRLLSASFFADPSVRAGLATARAGSTALGRCLRVRFHLADGASELHQLIWESLYDPEEDRALFTGERVLFSRYLEATAVTPSKPIARTALKALVVVANPSNLSEYGLAPLDLQAEIERAEKGLAGIETVFLESDGKANLETIFDELRGGIDILYMVCHGSVKRGDSWLWLETPGGTASRVSGRELINRLSGLNRLPRLAVLISCQSADSGPSVGDGAITGLAPALVAAGLPAVLAMRGKVSMITMSRFLPVFLRELRRDGFLDRAMAVARGSVLDRPDWGLPALFTRLISGRLWRHDAAGFYSEPEPEPALPDWDASKPLSVPDYQDADKTTQYQPEKHTRNADLVPCLTICAHPVPGRIGARVFLEELAQGREVLINRNQPDFSEPGRALGLPLADPFISRKPFGLKHSEEGGLLVEPGPTGTKIVIDGRTLTGPFHLSAEAVERGITLELSDRVALLLHWSHEDFGEPEGSCGVLGASDAVNRLRLEIHRIAPLNVPVLIRGEAGTGRHRVARTIHAMSPRAGKPFIRCNLGAVPAERAVEELAGTAAGGRGLLAGAHGGVLFLQDIETAREDVQVLLMRVLERGEVIPVGAAAPQKVDVRLIVATEGGLEDARASGRFKASLAYGLSGYQLGLPALRERPEDICRIFLAFARYQLEEWGEASRLHTKDPYVAPWLPTGFAARINRFSWPGNLTQLQNVVRQLLLSNRGRETLTVGSEIERLLS